MCGVSNAPLFKKAGVVPLQKDPCVAIFVVPESMKNVSSVDVKTKLQPLLAIPL